ncbi:MAG: N-acetylmuramoyl-L-alanine amidase [Elainella sp. Prado103]|nr:N-acetylmuramoyl-L-alanine amidase [Elainella sp. Prado103]
MATLQITSFPSQVRVEEFLSISGTSQDLAGQPLTLVIDNQFQMGAGAVPSNGLWSFRFRFTSPGSRSLVILAQDQQGNGVRSQTIAITVVNATPPPLQITALPAQVRISENFTFRGIAQGLDNRPLTLIVDDQYRFTLGNIPVGGNWGAQFRLTSPGNRKLVVSATNSQGTALNSPAVNLLVTDTPLPQIAINTFPAQVAVRQEFVISGTASGLAGQPVTLTIDNQFKTTAGMVAANGTWQSVFQFLQPGMRRLTASVENLANPVISNTVTITVAGVSPRLLITPPDQPIYAETEFELAGEARNFADGEQLVIQADRKYILGRPIVQNQRWRSQLFFYQPGQRLIEVIASDQEKAQIELTIQATPSSLQIFPRSIWSSTTTSEGIPDLLNPKRITLHHTVIALLPTTATQAQEIQRMRQILDIHLNSSGYSDIGYHYIIMPSGRIYEGRNSRKRGAHDLVNDGVGVAVDGDFQGSLRIGAQQYEAVVGLCTLLCKRLGISDPVTPVSTITADFGTRSLARILGHRDRVITACPGTLADRLAGIRQEVKQRLS